MPWNWELADWPKFKCNFDQILDQERKFLFSAGSASAFLKNITSEERHQFSIEILSSEGLKSSLIEGEVLDRESLQSSIKRHFGLISTLKKERPKEASMAMLLCNVYETFSQPLSHEMLFQWHEMLFKDHPHLTDIGKYRTHIEPMQIVSGRYDHSRAFFEAPPSNQVHKEMSAFIKWFNSASGSILGKAAIAHVYFESIHPFEDGNGRIGRVLVEKILSQGIGRPVLMAVSKTLEKRKKEYYTALEKCNRTLEIQQWIKFFADIVLEGQSDSMKLLNFLIQKSKMLSSLAGELNIRQEKALLRLFAEGPEGFKGGLSAENYISITKTTRATATRDLKDLVEKGALVQTGQLRYMRYHLKLDNQETTTSS